MRYYTVPKGKEVVIPAGRLRFTEGMTIDTAEWQLPNTFTDGTQLRRTRRKVKEEEVDDTKKSDADAESGPTDDSSEE